MVVACAPMSADMTAAAAAVGARPTTLPPVARTASAARERLVVLPAPAGPMPKLSSFSSVAKARARATWPSLSGPVWAASTLSKVWADTAGMTVRWAAARTWCSVSSTSREV